MYIPALQEKIDREHELLTAALAKGDAECAAAHAGAIQAYSFVKQWEEATRARISVLAAQMQPVGVGA